MKRLLTVLPVLLLTSCAAKKVKPNLEYLYRVQSGQELLIPPGGALPSHQKIDVRLGKARLGRKRGNACGIQTETLRLEWNKSAARLYVDVAGTDDPTRIPLSTLEDINKFRAGLVALESNGCLRVGEAVQLLNRMLETIALPTRTAYSLRYGNIYQGYIDVQPPMRIKVVVPLREGVAVGFETAWYRIDKGRLVAERVEASRKGQVSSLPKPNLAVVKVEPAARFYRIFFLTRRSPNDHDILLLTGRTMNEVEAATVKIRANSEPACKANPWCILVPQGSAISAEMPVMARGRQAYAPVSGSVSDVLRAFGLRQPQSVKNLTVIRPFGKLLIPVTRDGGQGDILGLVLIGGEQLNWEQ